ncbi:MAG: (d)CMP kinase [Candidatus Omnitrophica bacterium]|nr:(d)CMP kinase [Candidatus Omnitrophota bacterium]
MTASTDGAAAGRTRSRRRWIIAIDGPAGSGKSSTARALARRLGLPYIDTGAMYRAVTLQAVRDGVPLKDAKRLAAITRGSRIVFRDRNGGGQRVFLNGKDVSEAIRGPRLTRQVFYLAREPLVRRELVKKQRRLGRSTGGVIEGRDIGTVVFPRADFKFYFDAHPRVRARRRYKELRLKGEKVSLREVARDVTRRDQTDFSRKVSPLRVAKDAVVIDTSALTIEETVDRIIALIQSKSLNARGLNRTRSRSAARA